jgi:hypothetical protein
LWLMDPNPGTSCERCVAEGRNPRSTACRECEARAAGMFWSYVRHCSIRVCRPSQCQSESNRGGRQ